MLIAADLLSQNTGQHGRMQRWQSHACRATRRRLGPGHAGGRAALASCPANTLMFDEGVLDAQLPQNAKGDATPSSPHSAAVVRQKPLAPEGLAPFSAERIGIDGHRPSRYALRRFRAVLHPKWANQTPTYLHDRTLGYHDTHGEGRLVTTGNPTHGMSESPRGTERAHADGAGEQGQRADFFLETPLRRK